MRKTSSEMLNELENRIARLEKQSFNYGKRYLESRNFIVAFTSAMESKDYSKGLEILKGIKEELKVDARSNSSDYEKIDIAELTQNINGLIPSMQNIVNKQKQNDIMADHFKGIVVDSFKKVSDNYPVRKKQIERNLVDYDYLRNQFKSASTLSSFDQKLCDRLGLSEKQYMSLRKEILNLDGSMSLGQGMAEALSKYGISFKSLDRPTKAMLKQVVSNKSL